MWKIVSIVRVLMRYFEMANESISIRKNTAFQSHKIGTHPIATPWKIFANQPNTSGKCLLANSKINSKEWGNIEKSVLENWSDSFPRLIKFNKEQNHYVPCSFRLSCSKFIDICMELPAFKLRACQSWRKYFMSQNRCAGRLVTANHRVCVYVCVWWLWVAQFSQKK